MSIHVFNQDRPIYEMKQHEFITRICPAGFWFGELRVFNKYHMILHQQVDLPIRRDLSQVSRLRICS